MAAVPAKHAESVAVHPDLNAFSTSLIPNSPTCSPNRQPPIAPLSVWELTSQIKDLMEAAFPAVWVTGEVSNFARPQSGHCYLTLKDDRAQLRAVIWRGVAVRAALRSARRPGSHLPRAARRLRPAGQLPIDHRRHRAAGHGGVGVGLAATAREAGPGGAFRPGPQAAAAARSCGGSPW